ncbi:polysaccharide deacetylase family protein [soil metagenome]
MNIRTAWRHFTIGTNGIAPVVAIVLYLQGHGWWALAAVMIAHALWLVPTLWPQCDWCGEVLSKLPTDRKDVWLTIDDGPDAEDTPQLLDLLDQHQAQATFFFIGAKAMQHPELVAEVWRRGHQVGNHTMTHPQYRFWFYGPGAVHREIESCQQVLTEAGKSRAPAWFRAPAGFKNPFVSARVEKLGLDLACWSVRGRDGVDSNKQRVLERLKKGIKPGAIILMHEGRLDEQGQRLAPQVLSELLQWLADNGYRCVLPESNR